MRARFLFVGLLLLVAGSASAAGLNVPEFQTVGMDSGLRVQLLEHKTVPMVYLELWIEAGAANDPDGLEGLASLTADALRKGAGDRSASEFAETVDFLGANFNTSVNTERTRVRMNLQARDFELGLSMLADVILRPAFDTSEVEKLRDQAAEGVTESKENPRNVLGRYHAAHLYGDHVYGRPVDGDEESLLAVNADAVRAFHRDHYGADRAILTVVGDVDPELARAKIIEYFDAWKPATAERAVIAAPLVTDGPRVLLVNKGDTPQTWFMIGSAGPSWNDLDDYAATEVVRTVFGGRFTSWLNQSLRIEAGLTYGARYGILRQGMGGSARISTFTATETTKEAIDMALGQLDRLHADGLSEADLISAKAYIRGQMPYDFETAGNLATSLSQLAFYGIDRDHIDGLFARIEAVTLDDCRAATKKWFQREDLVFTAIGVASEVAEVMKPYGPLILRENNMVGFDAPPAPPRASE